MQQASLKVLHTISSLNLSSGGPSLSTWSLVSGLRNAGIGAEILTYSSGNPGEKMIGNGSFVNALSSPANARFGYSREISKFLKSNPFELYHAHGLWQYPTHAIASVARKKNKSYIITPRGMLYPEGLKKSALFKKVAMFLYQRNDLKKAAVIHVTCQQELEYVRELGFTNPVAIIPNAIEIKTPPKINGLFKEKKQIGFLGRFAPIKNLDVLIKAWAIIAKNNPNWELVLIGDGDAVYKNELVQLAAKLEIKNIRFTGFLFGEKKEKALQSLSYLILPSKSENFGMVVPEALIREIPVVASKGTPWEELNTRNAGWWIDIGVEPLVDALQKALETTEEQRAQMGLNGRMLVEQNYTIAPVAKKMIELYEWILEKTEKPDFVI